MTLEEMDAGQSGKIIQVEGGQGITRRLASMGLRVGKAITKVSAMLMRGPVTVKVDNSQIALGHGMAKKIRVKLEG
ncbi:ferrous iron transport protein A [Chloroflexota bacterium]